MSVERVYALFQKSVEAKMQVGEELASSLVLGAQVLVDALLNERKVLTCGNGASAALAQIFSSCLLDRYERERPGLPAIWLGGNVSSYTSIAADIYHADIYAKPVRALGQEGDVLLMLTSSGNANNLVQAIAAAHDRDMRVIVLSGRDGGHIAALLRDQDIEVCAPVQSRARIHEIHLLSIYCLCDLIDNALFGSEE